MLVYPPEMEVQSGGEDCKNRELEIVQHAAVGVMEEQRYEGVCQQDQKTTCIVGYVMIHQDNI